MFSILLQLEAVAEFRRGATRGVVRQMLMGEGKCLRVRRWFALFIGPRFSHTPATLKRCMTSQKKKITKELLGSSRSIV